MKRFPGLAAVAAAALALAAAMSGCVVTGDNAVGVVGWTVDPTNKVTVSRWAFPLYQWRRSDRGGRASKTYVLSGIGGWRVNRFGELAATWVHPLWYRDCRSLSSASSDTITRTTTVSVMPLVFTENVKTMRVEDPWDATPLSERTSVKVVPVFTYLREDSDPARVELLLGLFNWTETVRGGDAKGSAEHGEGRTQATSQSQGQKAAR